MNRASLPVRQCSFIHQGIVFSLVIVRIGLGLSPEGRERGSGSVQVSMGLFSEGDRSSTVAGTAKSWLHMNIPNRRNDMGEFALKPLEIKVSTVKRYDGDLPLTRGSGSQKVEFRTQETPSPDFV